ncbi:hypothetical protein AMS59_15885 [Lysinibacillus sp. FJAT-14745]|uniref:hypothetical protein n=1 Tax=Lysinibacillus sp. FJAT-14745 TaxID=1704289 RepID=UPI0006ABEABF|nr:hypothetical protein [Lysinibacillus sp. FJAT-14745]KOP72410.1 hypothetical protein AMS59_15885 [Lysinibacillus sp. FJAT-14745]
MFCVIQKIQKKKPDPYGTRKEIIVSETTFGFAGEEPKTSYGYTYSDERFERPVLDAYKISIHHSYRENGKVKKKQWAICTMSYYDLLEYSLYDCADSKIKNLSSEVDMSEEVIYQIINEKLDLLIAKIEEEFQQTEEYKVKKEQKAILDAHRATEVVFEKEYGSDEYRYCYDVFGTLRNPAYLEELKVRKKAQEEYARRSYEESFKRNYSNYSGNSSSYYTTSQSNYNEDEKKMLHEIYRMASKKFHPDACGDDGSKMKLLTNLKDQWGL